MSALPLDAPKKSSTRSKVIATLVILGIVGALGGLIAWRIAVRTTVTGTEVCTVQDKGDYVRRSVTTYWVDTDCGRFKILAEGAVVGVGENKSRWDALEINKTYEFSISAITEGQDSPSSRGSVAEKPASK